MKMCVRCHQVIFARPPCHHTKLGFSAPVGLRPHPSTMAATENLTSTLQSWWSDVKKYAKPAAPTPEAGGPAHLTLPLGPYEASDTMLGSGGYARVVLGRHRETGQKVAVKLLETKADAAKDRAASSEAAIVREVAALRRAGSHPNVCQLYGYFRLTDTCHAMVVELCRGGELFRIVEQYGAIDENKVRPIFNGVLAGLQHLHAQGIAHRDLKLENILLSERDGSAIPKIVDLGLAHVHARGADGAGYADRALTQFCGSRSYCAPEVMARLGYNGYTADVWSLGVCLFGLVSGFFPVDEASNRDWRYERLARTQHVHPTTSTVATIFMFYNRPCPLSPALVHLLDRVLQVVPAKRCALSDVAAAAWVRGEARPPQMPAPLAPPTPSADGATAAAVVDPPPAAETMDSSPQVEIDITDFLTRSGGSSSADWPQIDPSVYRSLGDEPGAMAAAAPPRICRQRAEDSVGVAAT